MRLRTLAVVLLVIGALLAAVVGFLAPVIHGGTCSPHEGGSGCGFKVGLVIPWVVAVVLAGAAIGVGRRR